jgi:hypothetical protein
MFLSFFVFVRLSKRVTDSDSEDARNDGEDLVRGDVLNKLHSRTSTRWYELVFVPASTCINLPIQKCRYPHISNASEQWSNTYTRFFFIVRNDEIIMNLANIYLRG